MLTSRGRFVLKPTSYEDPTRQCKGTVSSHRARIALRTPRLDSQDVFEVHHLTRKTKLKCVVEAQDEFEVRHLTHENEIEVRHSTI